jgi:hypothetical protein
VLFLHKKNLLFKSELPKVDVDTGDKKTCGTNTTAKAIEKVSLEEKVEIIFFII